MKNKIVKRYLYGLVLLLIGSCVDPYNPPAITSPNSYLVVDGYLNGGSGTSTIKLSRTQNLSDTHKPTAEGGATLRAEGENGQMYPFAESAGGTYTLANTELAFGKKYRLYIKTAVGREYRSDYVTVLKTPSIDSLAWRPTGTGVQFYVNAHDPANKTWYYRWEYEETWEFYSAYLSSLDVQNGQIVPRDAVNIYRCWQSQSSTNIFIGSSAQLTQDVISQHPLVEVPATATNRFRVRYSLLVKQYAQEKAAYQYWSNEKNNTENLGSLFDPQPSQLTGNIQCLTDPSEPVVGYISAFSVEEKRIFVKGSDLPQFSIPTGNESCEQDTLKPDDVVLGYKGGLIPISIIQETGNYLVSSAYCVDCRLRGTNVAPSYW